MTTRLERQDAILEAALQHVPFDGWSRKTMLLGAQDAGVDPATARRLFPRGTDDLLAHLNGWADRRMLERLAEQDLAALRVRERIALAVRTRLELLAPHREALRRAVAARLLTPGNVAAGGRALWRTVDAMWAAAGDTAADFNHYSKRALLAGVYASTFFYWLQDESDEHAASWAFLERRIDDVMRIPRLGGGLRACAARLNPLRRRRAA